MSASALSKRLDPSLVIGRSSESLAPATTCPRVVVADCRCAALLAAPKGHARTVLSGQVGFSRFSECTPSTHRKDSYLGQALVQLR